MRDLTQFLLQLMLLLQLRDITSASINALTAPADNTAIATLKLILQNHVITLGTKADDLLAAGYTRTFASVKST